MFGYVRPLRQRLSDEDQKRYQGAYCGLCHQLKRQCGFLARFTLSYDFVFLFLLLDDGADEALACRRCAAHPLEGRPCLAGGQAMELCARESVILAYYKLLDDSSDEGFWKSLGCRLTARLLRGAYERARDSLEELDGHVAACLEELGRLEAENSSSLDRVADAFARLLAGCARPEGEAGVDRPRQQLLYHLGRWIYLADAVDDLSEDAARGRYNPISARFGDTPDLDYLDTTMTHSLTLAQSAYQLLPRSRWSALLENVLYLGLPGVQKLVLAGEWKGGRTRKVSVASDE